MNWIEWILKKVFRIEPEVKLPRKHSRVTKEEVNLIIELYQAEWEIESIAQLTGRCKSTIYRYVRDLK